VLPATLTTDDGLALRLREWPLTGARGTVLLVHGLGEHAGRYDRVAARLNRAGWRVVGYDHRGHGTSGGARGALARDDDLLRDLARVVDAVRAEQAGAPLLLLGHSMGGAVAARFVADGVRAVDGLILSSPALDAGLNPLQKLLLAVLGPLLPNLAVPNGLVVDRLSRDAATVAAYRLDTLVHDRITPRLTRFIVDAGAAVRVKAAQWRVPTLLLWAGGDALVAPRGSAAFAAAAPRDVVTAHCFDGLDHEVFNEPEREQVFAALDAWLAAYTGRSKQEPAAR
jgi:alpha-beta hydrolase superfamily lysophospholipase